MPGKLAGLLWKDFVSKNPGTTDTPVPPIEAFRTNARDNAPLATAQPSYPVLIFAPGLGGHPLEYSNLIEDIVSHGYIVAAITPTYYSGFTILADGRVPPQRPFGSVVTPGPTMTQDELAAMLAAATAQINEVQDIWAGDISFALDVLTRENGNAQSVLRGRLDLARVGVFGHSLGGIAAVRAARTDRRLRAIVSLDGAGLGSPVSPPVVPVANDLPLDQPVLMISASIGVRDYATTLRGATRAAHIRLLGAAHPFPTDFGVLPLPRRAANAGATIEATRALAVTKVYTLAFFDQHLRGVMSELLAGPSASYPEIVFVSVARGGP